MTTKTTNTTPAAQSAGSKAAADVAALLRARNPLLWIVTREEGRVERLLLEAAQAAQYEPVFWDCATGTSRYDGTAIDSRATDPAQAIAAIRDVEKRQVWILRDMPAWLRDPTVNRGLRTLARTLPLAPREKARAVIVLTPSTEVPPELAGHAIVIEWPIPDRSEIAAILDSAIQALPDDVRKDAAPNGTREAAIDAAVGLTAEEAQACYAKSLVSTRRIDPLAVATEKKRVIAREKVLEWFDPLPGGLDAVGGLDELKTWLNARRARWETVREIPDPQEFEAATVARSKARSAVAGICCPSSFGLLCPSARENELAAAIAQARKVADEFNAGAQLSRVEVFCLVGRIAQDDAEAMRAVGSEVRDLLEAMQAGIKAADPAAIREAANKARNLGAMLTTETAVKVDEAITQARAAARAIVKRVEKAGELAADVVKGLRTDQISNARFSFLDLDAPADVVSEAPAARAIDLDADTTPAPATLNAGPQSGLPFALEL